MQTSKAEKLAFVRRLKQALKRSSKKVDTPTELALQFNLRHQQDSITPAAAQKWLTGQAQPTIDKIETLADWLNVSPHWLRHGTVEDRPTSAGRKGTAKKSIPTIQPTEDELMVLTRLRSLSEHRHDLVIEILEQFSIEQEMWKNRSDSG